MTLVVLPANHWLWYLAQISLGASFVAPSVVILRLLLATGFTCLFIWSIAVLKVSVDSAVFAGAYLLINFGVFLGLLWRMRHVKFDVDREAVYTRYFEADSKGNKKAFNLSRAHWQSVNEESEIVTVPAGELVAKSGDRCDSVTFLLSGKLSYFHEIDRKEGKSNSESRLVMHAHGVAQMGVVDAVEWVHRDTPRGPVWGISVRAVEPVRLLRLKYAAIDRASNNYREAAIMPLFNSICGIQVAQLLFDAENEHIADYEKSSNTSPTTTSVPQSVVIDIAPINSNQQQLKTSNTEMVRWHVE